MNGAYAYTFDKDKRLTSLLYPSGKQITNVYSNGHVSQTQTSEGNYNYAYLSDGRLNTISKGTETVSYAYDGPLVTSSTVNGIVPVTYSVQYNNDFAIQSFQYNYNNTPISYACVYDTDGLLTQIGGYTIDRKRNTDSDPGDGNPWSVHDGTVTVNRAFTGYGEQEAQQVSVAGVSAYGYDLAFDSVGRVVGNTETLGVAASYGYGYDAGGRLTCVTKNGTAVERYTYGSNGVRTGEINALRGITARTFAYDTEDHLLSSTTNGVTTTYTYDVDGFLQTKTVALDVTTYTYSSQGKLLGVQLPNGATITYSYDVLGRRVVKKVNGVVTEKYVWSGSTTLLAVYDGTDQLKTRFEYADDRVPIALYQNDIKYYITCNQVGSVRAVFTTTGTLVKSIDYDAFGNIIADTNPSFAITLGFAGGLYDPDTHLIHFAARDYDPDTGRWTAKDPIGFAGGDTNLYGYCVANPIMFCDPYGLWWNPLDWLAHPMAWDVPGPYGDPDPSKWGSWGSMSSWNNIFDGPQQGTAWGTSQKILVGTAGLGAAGAAGLGFFAPTFASASIGTLITNGTGVVATTAATGYGNRVVSQLENHEDVFHGFPTLLDKLIMQSSPVLQGLDRIMYSAQGTLNNHIGEYRIITNAAGEIFHRFFHEY